MRRVPHIGFRRHLAGLMETLHLLRSPANAKHLLSSIKDADAGKLTEHDLIEEPEKDQ